MSTNHNESEQQSNIISNNDNIPSCQEQNLNIAIPKEYTNSDILFKIQNKKETPQKVLKFRSFSIRTGGGCYLVIKSKKIHITHLFTVLKNHGLSETLPISVTLGPLTFNYFDWKPCAYGGPTVWPFDWRGVECSITGDSLDLYIRVHDLTPNLGENILNEITEELLQYWQNPVPNASLIIYTTQRHSPVHPYQWVQNCTRLHRNIDTIYIDSQVKLKLINQLTKFYNSSDKYDRYGITWKRVHLFHGPPGSGKTSTVLALASVFGKNISKLTLTPDLNSQDIERLFQTIHDDSFLLLEDVDALFTKRESNTSIDFSTLLNCMDGIATKRGLVLFMTTNHVTSLDSAFIRPGRVDLSLEFKLPGREELHGALKVLGANYIHEYEEFLNKHTTDMSIAGLQKHLFECMMEEKESILF